MQPERIGPWCADSHHHDGRLEHFEIRLDHKTLQIPWFGRILIDQASPVERTALQVIACQCRRG